MDRKAKRNKEVHTAIVQIPAGTQVRDLMTGELLLIETGVACFAWYTLEKMQWFYWTALYTGPDKKERLVMVRRDKAHMKSGTHRTVHRETVQNRMRKILEASKFTNMRIPPPPNIERRKETCPEEWKQIYQSFHTLVQDIHIRKPWTEERRAKAKERYLKQKEEKAAALAQEPGSSPEPEPEPEDSPEHSASES